MVLVLDPEENKGSERVLDKVKKWLGRKGRLKKEKNWGTKDLAYPLKSSNLKKKIHKANYIWLEFEAGADLLANIRHNLQLEEKLLRFLLVSKKRAL